MLSIVLLAASVVCSGGGSTPIVCTGTERPPTAAEAAAILAPGQFVYVPPLPDGPQVFFVSSDAWPSLEHGPVPWPADFGRPLTTGSECYGVGCYSLYGGVPFFGAFHARSHVGGAQGGRPGQHASQTPPVRSAGPRR
jgi:hypothetical protein